jgi:Glycosyl hydrolases family 2, TIM barrel domain/Glycosyl hydrolases family 2
VIEERIELTMRRPALLLVLLSLFAFPLFEEVSASQKNTLLLNGDWTVQINGQTMTVQVPTNVFFVGNVSVWTKSFTLNLQQAPVVAYLDFGGIANTATVKLNGFSIGSLVAYTHARLDVTTALSASGLNVLEVDIDDRLVPTTLPGGATGPFVAAFGNIGYMLPVAWAPTPGIVRNVSLFYSDRPAIMDAMASEVVSADLTQVTVTVKLLIAGTSTGDTASVAIAGNGAIVGSCQAKHKPNTDLACAISLRLPRLWSPSSPNLYDLWVELQDSQGVADFIHDQTGFRRFESRGNQLYLNGQPLFLRGITRHDIYANGSFVADEPTIVQDLQRLKQLGVNYIRCIHYPPDPRVAVIADQMGILLSEEIPAYADFTNPVVIQTAQSMMAAMIERDFNRPSVIFWIAGNGNVLYAPYLQQTAASAKAADSTRPVSFVVDDPLAVTPPVMQTDLGIINSAGMDLYLQNGYWWPWVIAALVPSMPTDKPIIITEWAGAEGSNRGPLGPPSTAAFPGWTYDGTGTFSEEFQATTMLYTLDGWLPYVTCTQSQTPCVTGLTFYNFQDIEWPGLPFFGQGHYQTLHSGLFYEDRTPKAWPMAIFQYGISVLPQ